MLLNVLWLGASCYLNFPNRDMVGFYVIKAANISIRGTGHSIYPTFCRHYSFHLCTDK